MFLTQLFSLRDFLLRINFSTSFPQKSHLSNVPFFNGLNAYYKTQLCSHEYTINTPFHAFRIVASTNSSSKNLIQFLISDNISINLLKTKIYISIFFQRQPTHSKRTYTDLKSILSIFPYIVTIKSKSYKMLQKKHDHPIYLFSLFYIISPFFSLFFTFQNYFRTT